MKLTRLRFIYTVAVVWLLFVTSCGGEHDNSQTGEITPTQEVVHVWTRTNPGGGGAVATVGATLSGVILAASDLSGVYRSGDNGATWDVLGASNGLQDTHISSLGFHTTNDDIYFVGTGDGLYRTMNGQAARAEVTLNKVLPNQQNPFNVEYIEDIVVAKSKPRVVYVTQHLWEPVTQSSIYKSSDTGNTWQEVAGKGLFDLAEDQHVVKLLVHPLDDKILYALTGLSRWGCSKARLYKTVDAGENWEQVAKSQFPNLDILDMDINPQDVTSVYFSSFEANPCPEAVEEGYEYVVEQSAKNGFYKASPNNTVKLTNHTGIINVNNQTPNIIQVVDIFLPFEWYDDSGTWETQDSGTTWRRTGYVENWRMGYTNNPYYAFSASMNGLSKTLTKDLFTPGRMYGAFGQWAWASFDAGVHVNNVSTLATNNGWRSTGMDNINGNALDVSDSNPDVVYMGGYDIGFWYSKNHGKSWNRTQPDYRIYPNYVWTLDEEPSQTPANFAVTGEGANVSTLLNDPERENVVWASFGLDQYYNDSSSSRNNVAQTGLFKSTEYGHNWQLITQGLPHLRSEAIRFYGLSLDIHSPINQRTLYVTIKGDVYKSVDDGASWKKVFVQGGLKFTQVDKFNPSLVYAGGESGLWRSVNAGENWEEVGLNVMRSSASTIRADIVPTYDDEDTGLKAWQGVFDIKTDPHKSKRVYVTVYGENKGLYRSKDAGETWEKLITDDFMRCLSISPSNENILYATSSSAYHSGSSGNSGGVMYSQDFGATWLSANDGMAWHYGGKIEIETGASPSVWVWSPGTGVQYSPVANL